MQRVLDDYFVYCYDRRLWADNFNTAEGEMLVQAAEAVESVMARNDVQVKLDAAVVTEAKMVASAKGITLAQYLSEMIRPLVRRDLEAETSRIMGGSTSKAAKPKGGK